MRYVVQPFCWSLFAGQRPGKKHAPLGIPLPKSDLVGCFFAGSSREHGPDFTELRETVRTWLDAGQGYFVSHGKYFQILGTVIDPQKELLGHSNLIPFSRVPNRMRKPESINYPIPAYGDHRLRWHHAFMTQPNV